MRDRLSSDLLRIVSQFGDLARAPGASAWGYIPAGDALAVLNHCIGTLAALRGIEMENMTRGPGWRFLNIGRRIERSIHLVKLFRAIIVPLRLETWPSLEMLLEVADSSMTYRARYFTTLQAAPALDLLMNDEANPRSLAFQVKDLTEHCRSLSSMPSGAGWPVSKQKRLEEAASNLFRADIGRLCIPDTNGVRVLLDELLSRNGRRVAHLFGRDHAYLFQSRGGIGAGHLIYRVRHVTIYDYEDPVSVSHHVLRLTPRNLPRQRCSGSQIAIAPAPPSSTTRIDYFGNVLTFFTLREPHDRLTVEASSELEVQTVEAPDFSRSPRWETVPQSLEGDSSVEVLDAYQFVFDSRTRRVQVRNWRPMRAIRFPGRPLLEAVRDLTRRIHQDFRFDTKATEVTTPVETFFEKRRGVCQDFAHLEIACLRSLGLPARYVSGYLRTMPPPGSRAFRGRRRVARLVFGVVPGRRMGGFRPHQRLRALGRPRHSSVGARLQRCQPYSRCSPRWRPAHSTRGCGCDSDGVMSVRNKSRLTAVRRRPNLNVAQGKRRLVFDFVHPIGRPAVVRVEPVFILSSNRPGEQILRAAFDGFPGEARIDFRIRPAHTFNPRG